MEVLYGLAGLPLQHLLPGDERLADLAAGADGLFLETHPQPEAAISDGPNMIPLGELAGLLERCLAVWRAARGPA